MLLLVLGDNKTYLLDSLSLWKSLTDSEKFWAYFLKAYTLHDEQTASQEIVASFMDNVSGYLADFYTELHQIYKDSDYINEFQKLFKAKAPHKINFSKYYG